MLPIRNGLTKKRRKREFTNNSYTVLILFSEELIFGSPRQPPWTLILHKSEIDQRSDTSFNCYNLDYISVYLWDHCSVQSADISNKERNSTTNNPQNPIHMTGLKVWDDNIETQEMNDLPLRYTLRDGGWRCCGPQQKVSRLRFYIFV